VTVCYNCLELLYTHSGRPSLQLGVLCEPDRLLFIRLAKLLLLAIVATLVV
jgi:hypothetical protein